MVLKLSCTTDSPDNLSIPTSELLNHNLQGGFQAHHKINPYFSGEKISEIF